MAAKVFAHRGASGERPENTISAFSLALEEGADGIELDVHLSKDGEVMIIHDESLLRTAGIDRMVSEMTRSELEATSAGKTFSDEFGFTPIPSLEEYLCFMEGRRDKLTNIELKTAPLYYPGIEEKVMALVAKHGLESNIIYSSFNWLSVVKVKRMDPSAKVGLLFSGMPLHNLGAIMRDLDIACFHPDFHDLSEDIVKSLHSEGREVNVWTVNGPEDIRSCLSWGADGIITNHPLRALHELGRA